MKKKNIIIVIVLTVLMALLAGIFFLNKNEKEQEIEATSSKVTNGTIETGKIWANDVWLSNIDKSTIEKVVFTNQVPPTSTKSWEYDGVKITATKTELYLYNEDKIKITGSAANMFADFTALKTVEGTEYVDFSKSKNVSGLFKNCVNLEEIDLETNDFTAAEDVSSMFEGCKKLNKFKINNAVLNNVKNADSMFNGCEELNTIYMPGMPNALTAKNLFNSVGLTGGNTVLEGELDFSNCTDYTGMFANSSFSNYSFVENLATSKMENATDMFRSSMVENLDLSKWDTSNLKIATNMFRNCPHLKVLNTDSWDCSKLETCKSMFDSATGLCKLTLNWKNISNIKDMSAMFKDCVSIITLDLSCFNDVNVEDATQMFYGGEYIEQIKCSKITATASEEMFTYCVALKGKIPFDATKTNASMATSEGYFIN